MVHNQDLLVDISIIYVNYYSEQEIIKSINSISNSSIEDLNIEIIIVSNSMLNNSDKNLLQSSAYSCSILQLEGNIGFAAACNKGARIAKGSHLFFLNPDTILRQNTLTQLFKFYSSLGQKGLIGPKIYDENENITGSTKNKVSLLQLVHNAFPAFGVFFPDKYHSGQLILNQTKRVDVVSGCAMFISADLYQKLTG
jgi:N-acetylglucosaminyl-diphospho-decaprenol L-rhamnosyltransferase